MRELCLYLVPHQDDELLTMGLGILRDLRQHDVHLLLLTDGGATGAVRALNRGGLCPKCVNIHRRPVSRDAMMASRMMEFRDSARAMGVASSAVHLANPLLPDGALAEDDVLTQLRPLVHRLGVRHLRCLDPMVGPDQVQDHRVTGRAALRLAEEGTVASLELFREPYVSSAEHYQTISPEPQERRRLLAALASYRRYSPRHGRYAVGLHSVWGVMRRYKRDMRSYVRMLPVTPSTYPAGTT
jgi:LmbE family N-acetylglucosaminyl deacetylase